MTSPAGLLGGDQMPGKSGRSRSLEDQDVMGRSEAKGIDSGQAVRGQHRRGLPQGESMLHGGAIGGGFLLPVDVDQPSAGSEQSYRLVQGLRREPVKDVG